MHQIDHRQLLASIAAASHDCIISVDRRGTVLWASPATLDLLGWRPEDLAGSDLAVITPRLGGDVHQGHVSRLLMGERIGSFTDTVVRRDGSTFKASVMLGPVHDADGAVTGVTVILRDVAPALLEQRELAQALEVSRAHFEQVATPQAVLDLSGRLASVNPAWCELFGRPAEHFTDRDLLSLVHPMDLHQVAARLEALGSDGQDSITYQGVFRDADGRSLSLLIDAAALREADGTPYAVAVSARDLALVEEARRAAAVRSRLYEALGRRPWAAALVLDADLQITSVTPAVTKLLGYEPAEAVRVAAWEGVLHPADSAMVTDALQRVRAEAWRTERFVVRVRHRDGRWLWVEETVTNCLEDPDIRGLVANLRDITEQARTEEALRLSEALHRALLETAQDGILALAPDGRTAFANERVAEILGRPLEDLYGADGHELLGLASWDEVTSRFEMSYRHPDGDERTLQVTRNALSGPSPEPLGSLVTVSDVTEVRQVERNLRRRAMHDPLTGLPNRYLFEDRLETAAARQTRSPGQGTAVLFLDLDRFKPINDGHGHDVGDEVLQVVARRLSASVRATDTVGRLGGDEFAIICEDTDEAAAVLLAARILGSLREPVDQAGPRLELSVSIGIAVCPPHPFEELVRRADGAMYRAKHLGGGRIAVARPGDGVGSPTELLTS